MSYLVAADETIAAAANDIATVGSALRSANLLAAAPTTTVLAAAADQVSAAVASLFNGHAQQYQALSGQFAAVHEQFVQTLAQAAGSYDSAEATNATLQTEEQNALGVSNAPAQTLIGRPLIGNGADGTAANPNGGAGGLLYSNGGQRVSLSTANAAGGAGGRGGWLLWDGGAGGCGGSGAAAGFTDSSGGPRGLLGGAGGAAGLVSKGRSGGFGGAGGLTGFAQLSPDSTVNRGAGGYGGAGGNVVGGVGLGEQNGAPGADGLASGGFGPLG